jgi:NAD(P)H dehydrogenase (quinone)
MFDTIVKMSRRVGRLAAFGLWVAERTGAGLPKVGVVYHSGFGHTAAQARAVGEGVLRVPGVEAEMYFAEDAASEPTLLDSCDALILGCPTYMAGASAAFKAFIDATSGIWLKQGWQNKLCAGFTNSGGHSGDKLNTLMQLMLFAMQHGMVWVGLGLLDGGNSTGSTRDSLNRLGSYAGAMSQSNVDQGVDGMTEGDLATAAALGERVAWFARQWSEFVPAGRLGMDGEVLL